MNPSVEALENQYFLLRGSLRSLQMQGATDAQLDTLRKQIAQSRTDYWKAANGALNEDDPRVQALVSQLDLQRLTLAATLEHLGDVAKVLDAITKAVSVGSELAGLVA